MSLIRHVLSSGKISPDCELRSYFWVTAQFESSQKYRNEVLSVKSRACLIGCLWEGYLSTYLSISQSINKVSQWRPHWTGTHSDSPTSASSMLRLQLCTLWPAEILKEYDKGRMIGYEQKCWSKSIRKVLLRPSLIIIEAFKSANEKFFKLILGLG